MSKYYAATCSCGNDQFNCEDAKKRGVYACCAKCEHAKARPAPKLETGKPTAIEVLTTYYRLDPPPNPDYAKVQEALKLLAVVEHPEFYDMSNEADGLSVQLEVKIPICDPVTNEDTGHEKTEFWFGTPDEAYDFIYDNGGEE